ncbi:hypothetical protein JKF63_05024 [Porcisia hertigi]|uniref:Uncharacterized protein n=1 Tax=Porcisia hertigi TaxID=2761500 RepID=A0A836IA58_9TRYP|nr:hypothetical protein JKF63_05024 [Porcisia hertigi]
MAKKRHARRASLSSATADSGSSDASGGLRPVFSASMRTTTGQEALHAALNQLDSIAQEAHTYTQQLTASALSDVAPEATQPPLKRARDKLVNGEARLTALPVAKASRLDVLAAMSAPHYQALCAAVATYGLQLLPSLEDILKRMALAVQTPCLSTPEAWETLAVLCTTYRAGAAHALTELLESLLREPGVFMLDAPQLVPAWYAETFVHVLPTAMASNATTAALGGLLTFAEDQKLRECSTDSSQQAARIHTDRTERKLRALVDMLYAAGEYVPASTLQQTALRHVMEVVEGGVLPCYLSEPEYSEVFNTASAIPGTATATDSTTAAVLRWRVPAAWHAVSLQLLEAFLFTCHPSLPAQLLVTTTRTTNVLAARLHRGVPLLSAAEEHCSATVPSQDGNKKASPTPLPPLPVTAAVGAAVVHLGHVLQLLRHPVVLPPLQPAQLTVEKAKQRMFVLAEPAAAPSTPTPAVPAEPSKEAVAALEAPVMSTPLAPTAAPPAAVDVEVPADCVVPAVVLPSASASPPTPALKSAAPVVPRPAPQPRKSMPPPAVVDDADGEIPDIVMDD